MSDNFHAGGGEDYRKALINKFKWKRKAIKDKLDQATSPEQENELNQEMEQLDREHEEKEGQIDDSLF